MSSRFITLLTALIVAIGCAAKDNFLDNVRYSEASPRIFEKVAGALAPYKDEPADALIVRCAREFLGTEYVAGTLEIEPERLTVKMDSTDCILFVEMCLAMVQTVKSDDPTFENFCRNTQALRYRDGKVDGYASRNHYTSAWIRQGEKNGIFKEMSRDLGGRRFWQELNFMSTHPESYKQLAADEALVDEIRSVERSLRGDCWILPQADLARLAEGVRSGDIICYCTTVDGLDIGHVAIAVEQDGQMHFIHASTKAMKVIIDSQTIADYVKTHKSTNGIRVVRLK